MVSAVSCNGGQVLDNLIFKTKYSWSKIVCNVNITAPYELNKQLRNPLPTTTHHHSANHPCRLSNIASFSLAWFIQVSWTVSEWLIYYNTDLSGIWTENADCWYADIHSRYLTCDTFIYYLHFSSTIFTLLVLSVTSSHCVVFLLYSSLYIII